MDALTYVVFVVLPLLMLGLGVIYTIAWNRTGTAADMVGKGSPLATRLVGMGTVFGLWLTLTAASVCLVFLGGLTVLYILLFWVGRAAAGVGIILLLALLLSIPLFWGWALSRPSALR